jgi:type I restriction enzyme S subunit
MEWPKVTIGDYLVRGELRDPTKRPREQFLYVDVSSVDNNAFAIRQSTELLGADAPSRARKVIRNRDVIFATVRPTLRRIALVEFSLDNQICSTGFCVLRPGPKLDAGFLYYWLLTDGIVQHVAKIEKGVSYPAIRDSDVKAIQMPYPPLAEQRQIATVLSAVQHAIGRQERLITLTAELKKALMHKLFTEGTRGEPLKQTEIGPVPETWALARLRDFMKVKHGYAFDGAYFRLDGQLTLMTPGHFDEAGGFRDQGARTKYYVGEVPPGYTLSANDLLVAMTEQKSGLLGSAALVPTAGTFLHNQRLGLITNLNESKLTKDFLYFFFNRPEVKSQVAVTATGSKVRHTSPGKLLDLVIALPTVAEQRLISHGLHQVTAKQHVHVITAARLAELFRNLLHQLMTAQIRIQDLDLSPLELPQAIGAA